jgi:hypothetical protein
MAINMCLQDILEASRPNRLLFGYNKQKLMVDIARVTMTEEPALGLLETLHNVTQGFAGRLEALVSFSTDGNTSSP